MNNLNRIQTIFPSSTEVPMNMVIPELLEQKHYLLDGKIVWIFSMLFIRLYLCVYNTY